MTQHFRNMIRDESGASMIEYALLAALVGLVGVAALSGIGDGVATQLGAVNNTANEAAQKATETAAAAGASLDNRPGTGLD